MLSVKGLRVEFPSRHARRRGGDAGPFVAVDDLSLELREGQTLGVVGESGAGKSTLGNCVVRLQQPTRGTIRFMDRDITHIRGAALRAARRNLQMVFQDPYSSLDPYMRVSEIIAEPLRAYGLGNARERRDTVHELLEAVGLDRRYAERYPRGFSGGQRQRIAIARALAIRPKLVVCDEIVSGLDVSVRGQIINLLKDLQDQYGTAYLFISHDLLAIRAMSDQVAVMNKGKLVEYAASDQIFTRPQHRHTRDLLAALPKAAPKLTTKHQNDSGDDAPVTLGADPHGHNEGAYDERQT